MARIRGPQPRGAGSEPAGGSNHGPIDERTRRWRAKPEDEVRILVGSPISRNARVKLVQKSPALGTRRPRGRTSHPDQLPLSSSGRTADSNPANGGSIPSGGAMQWRNGNAAVCKTAMSRLDTGLHLQCSRGPTDRASVF